MELWNKMMGNLIYERKNGLKEISSDNIPHMYLSVDNYQSFDGKNEGLLI